VRGVERLRAWSEGCLGDAQHLIAEAQVGHRLRECGAIRETASTGT
jgi:hypothetical protein